MGESDNAQLIYSLLLLLFGFSGAVHAARVLDHYDLKQLCEMADLIMMVEVIDATDVKTRDGDCAVWNVKIVSTLKGDAKPQAVLRIAGIEEYLKGPGIQGVSEGFPRLSKGETVYLFLVPKDAPMGYAKYRLTNAEWKVIESGARFVAGGNVFDFGQYRSPEGRGEMVPGFVAMTEKTFPGAPVLSVQTFEKQVKESMHVSSEPTTNP